MRPAIFLDRDGTIIEDKGYLKNPSDLLLFSESVEALNLLQKEYLLFIITNQSGISKGITTAEEVTSVNNFLLNVLKEEGIFITDLFVCPHVDEDNCVCKKPRPYFILEAAKTYDLDLNNSYIIGDHPSDIDCGLNANISSIYVLTGHGEKHKNELKQSTNICDNILDAAKQIINKIK